MMGIRVICAFLEDINLAIEQISALFNVVEVEHKGGQKFSEFGYESVHVLVKIPEECTPPLTDIYENLKEKVTQKLLGNNELDAENINPESSAEIEKNDISKIKVSISELAEQAMDLAGDNSAEEVSPDLGLEE